MDRVLVDHLSTWQWVYDKLGINNDESFALYNQGELDEWNWIILDLALIKRGTMAALGEELSEEHLRQWLIDCPMMLGWQNCIQSLLNADFQVAIISGGMQESAFRIASHFPSEEKWRKRWGGIDLSASELLIEGLDTRLHLFTNGWVVDAEGYIPKTGRFQVQMNGKGAITKMLQRRLGIPKECTAAIGDSSGDIGMFQQSGFSINFNPANDKAKPYADMVIEEKDLSLVLSAIIERI